MNWAELVDREPRLEELREEAAGVDPGDDPSFCANAVWYGYAGHAGIKPRFVHLVGWRADNPDLRNCRAYDIAYDRIYEELPGCRRCGCM